MSVTQQRADSTESYMAGVIRTSSFTATVLVLTFASLFIGCGRDPERAAAGRTLAANTVIGFIGPPATDAISAAVCGGAERFAAAYPNVHCLTVIPPDAQPSSLSAAVDETLARNPNAICLYLTSTRAPNDADHTAQLIERIRQTGIVLVTVGSPINNPAVRGHVEVALPQAAEILAQNLRSLLPPAVNAFGHVRQERSYALFHADGRDQSASDTYARFLATVRDNSNLARLADVNTWASDRSAQRLIADTLERFSTVELIVTLDPEPWLSLRPRLRLPPRNHFATLSAAPRLWPRLESGEALALVGPLDGQIGYTAMEVATQRLMLVPDAPTRRYIPCELVTKANLDDFAQRYAAAANLDVRDLLTFRPLP
jgi:ABC-type sugar transport system substrate-binding protein